MEILDEPKFWKRTENKSYHRAMLITIQWNSVWLSDRTSAHHNHSSLLGSEMELGPKAHSPDTDTDSNYSQLVDQALTKQWETLRKTFTGRLSWRKKLDILYDAYHRTHMELAYDTYGTRTTPDPQRTKALHAHRSDPSMGHHI